ncbi:hypothetical protein AMTRI_Chr01g108690 [Amborella trichopoda]
MRCESVQCLWSPSPPLHKITATALLNHHQQLFTGGSDGSIICWNFSLPPSPPPTNQLHKAEVWPMAMLCGHAAPISGLDICGPVAEHEETDHSSNIVSTSSGSEPLISACVDGVLCVWNSGNGYCRRRRKLPSWVGSPFAISSLPTSKRHVCIACISAESVHLSSQNVTEGREGRNSSQIESELLAEKESSHSRRSSKGAIVIVDACTLNILRTIFHGNLSIGPVKSITVVASAEEDHSVIMADSLGRVLSVAISKEHGPETENMCSTVDVETLILPNVVHVGIQGIAVKPHGKFLVFICRDHCIFTSMEDKKIRGELSLENSSLCTGNVHRESYLVGGLFLESDIQDVNASEVMDSTEGHLSLFLVWSNQGDALIYMISLSGDAFDFKLCCEIPVVSNEHNAKLQVSFCESNQCLIRTESFGFDVECSLIWRSQITVWLISQLPAMQEFGGSLSAARWSSSDPCMGILIGEGGFLDDKISNCDSLQKMKGHIAKKLSLHSRASLGLENAEMEKSCNVQSFSLHPMSSNGCSKLIDGSISGKKKIVTTSMILCEVSFAPCAVVYGFHNGEIEIIRLDMFFQEVDVVAGDMQHKTKLNEPRHIFLGHDGAVLCLAAHCMLSNSGQQNYNRLLVSGSADCTICIWNLDSGNLVNKLHHHVAPVRQIILPPPWTNRPWNDCFVSVGEDCCVSLASFETLRVERMFPGHPTYPEMVVWDSARGYIAALCRKVSAHYGEVDVLIIWDVKTGAQERVLRGAASHSMFDHFCRGISINAMSGNILGGMTSASSLLPHGLEVTSLTQKHTVKIEREVNESATGANPQQRTTLFSDPKPYLAHSSKGAIPYSKAVLNDPGQREGGHSAKQGPSLPALQNKKPPIKCSCPFPGIATLIFDLSSLMSLNQQKLCVEIRTPTESYSNVQKISLDPMDARLWVKTSDGCLLRFSLSLLHLWGIDDDLDKLLVDEMDLCKPEQFSVTSGLNGDRGAMTLIFPGSHSSLQLWKSSPEFCAMRSLAMVSLAQHMISLSHPTSASSSALAAFYTRNFAEVVTDIQPPLLQLLASFWQDPIEHVRMAARSLFHCAASRAIPPALCGPKTLRNEIDAKLIDDKGQGFKAGAASPNVAMKMDEITESQDNHPVEDSEILVWLESHERKDWISMVGGTSRDARASHIIVAAALAVWYPSLVKPSLATSVVHQLVKLVMAVNDKYSAVAAELLAEGMESTWKPCIHSEVPHLIGDVFFFIECLSGTSAIDNSSQDQVMANTIRKALIGILLPSLAMADILGFLNVIESQIWTTASDSPVHLVSLMTLMRVVRGAPKALALYIDKAVNFILQTMDHGNSVLRKACLQSSMAALREVVRVFPMVALNEASTKLAVGDAIGDIHNLTIQVYDLQSVTKVKVLDASGPPGLPSMLGGVSDGRTVTGGISALCFSPDGEGLVAFSEHGLMIRWWSLGVAWWEKLSRNTVPVQCTKLIFVPPWEGFSPNSSRSSIIASILGHDANGQSQEKTKASADSNCMKLQTHNLDLLYLLEWADGKKVVLMRHNQELGTFQL